MGKDDLLLIIHLPPPPESWDYVHASPDLVLCSARDGSQGLVLVSQVLYQLGQILSPRPSQPLAMYFKITFSGYILDV